MSDKGYIPSSDSSPDDESKQSSSRASGDDSGGRLPSSPDDGAQNDPNRPGMLPGGEPSSAPADSRRERIRRATAAGGLDALPRSFDDPEDSDWQVACSTEDPFEQLYLDHRQHEAVTDEMVRHHYDLISNFWKEKRNTLDAGVPQQARQIRKKYGGPHHDDKVVRQHLEQTRRAYGMINDADGRSACHRALVQARRAEGRAALLPLLQQSLRDGVLDPAEADGLFDQGREAGLSESAVAEIVMEHLEEKNFSPESRLEGDTPAEHLRAVRWMTREQHRQTQARKNDSVDGRAAAGAAAAAISDHAADRAAESRSSGNDEKKHRWALVAGGIFALVVLAGAGFLLLGDGGAGENAAAETRPEPEQTTADQDASNTGNDGEQADSRNAGEQPVTYEEGQRRAARRITETKREFRSELQPQLDDLVDQIGTVELEIQNLEAREHEDLRATLSDLRQERDAIERRLQEFPGRSLAELSNFKKDLRQRETRLRRRVESIRDRVSEASRRTADASGPESQTAPDPEPELDLSRVFGARAVDREPEIVGSLNPDYPVGAKLKGIEGQVVFRFVVDEDGQARDINVLKSPHDLLSESVKKEVQEAQFRPGLKNDTPVKVRVTKALAFKLE